MIDFLNKGYFLWFTIVVIKVKQQTEKQVCANKFSVEYIQPFSVVKKNSRHLG